MNEATSPDASPATLLLRLTAFTGTAAALLRHTTRTTLLQPRRAAGFVVLLVATFTVGFVLPTVPAGEGDDLLRHTNLRVSLGLFRGPHPVWGKFFDGTFGERESCEAEVVHTARAFDGA